MLKIQLYILRKYYSNKANICNVLKSCSKAQTEVMLRIHFKNICTAFPGQWLKHLFLPVVGFNRNVSVKTGKGHCKKWHKITIFTFSIKVGAVLPEEPLSCLWLFMAASNQADLKTAQRHNLSHWNYVVMELIYR